MEMRVKTANAKTLPAKVSLKRAEMYRVCELVRERITETAGVVFYKEGASDATIAAQAADNLKNASITAAVVARVRKQVFGPLADESGSMKSKMSALMAQMTQLSKHNASLERKLEEVLKRLDKVEDELTDPVPKSQQYHQPVRHNGRT